jgi:hypothetical protein
VGRAVEHSLSINYIPSPSHRIESRARAKKTTWGKQATPLMHRLSIAVHQHRYVLQSLEQDTRTLNVFFYFEHLAESDSCSRTCPTSKR